MNRILEDLFADPRTVKGSGGYMANEVNSDRVYVSFLGHISDSAGQKLFGLGKLFQDGYPVGFVAFTWDDEIRSWRVTTKADLMSDVIRQASGTVGDPANVVVNWLRERA